MKKLNKITKVPETCMVRDRNKLIKVYLNSLNSYEQSAIVGKFSVKYDSTRHIKVKVKK
jgi:hypothetical protein